MLYTLNENMFSLRMDPEDIAQSATEAKVTSKSSAKSPEVIYDRYVANVSFFVPIVN